MCDDIEEPAVELPAGECASCEHSEDLPPGVVFGEDDLYCSCHHCAVNPRHTCEEWFPEGGER